MASLLVSLESPPRASPFLPAPAAPLALDSRPTSSIGPPNKRKKGPAASTRGITTIPWTLPREEFTGDTVRGNRSRRVESIQDQKITPLLPYLLIL